MSAMKAFWSRPLSIPFLVLYMFLLDGILNFFVGFFRAWYAHMGWHYADIGTLDFWLGLLVILQFFPLGKRDRALRSLKQDVA